MIVQPSFWMESIIPVLDTPLLTTPSPFIQQRTNGNLEKKSRMIQLPREIVLLRV